MAATDIRRSGSTVLAAALAVLATLRACFPAAGATDRRAARGQTASGCPHANVRADHASAEVIRHAVVCLINRQRSSRHLPALRELGRLDSSAQRWTNVMVGHDVFGHVALGSDPGARISAAGFAWSSIGENIATGYPTPAAVMTAWMSSTGHCQNILSPSFRYVGQGVSSRDIRGISSGPATWTTDFGLPSGASAPSGNAGPASHCPY
ncbi:MAG: CAP domain-containing protein [Solirubrobacteraceae bacterium]